MKTITLSAYGKINLGLDVIGKRPNGYHDVKMIMQSVGLCDTLTVKKLSHTSDITLSTNLKELSSPRENLVFRAASLLKEKFHIQDGISLELIKRIPIAAGMAGGSTDAAATLKAINQLFELGIDQKELSVYALSLGADIPYCLLSGTALSEGIGELLTPLPAAPDCYVLLVNPNIHISTKYVYKHLDAITNLKHPDIDGMVEAIKQKNYQGIVTKLENVLETVTIKKAPIIEQIKQTMIELGSDGALMSGSGSTVFGLFSNENKCKQGAAYFSAKKQAQNEHWHIFTTHFQKRDFD